MRYAWVIGLLTLLGCATDASAQGSGSVAGPPTVGLDTRDLPFAVVKDLTGTIVDINAKGELTLLLKNGKKQTVLLERMPKIRAERGTEYAGKKKIVPEDLTKGMLVRVTYRPEDNRALAVKILKDSEG